MRGEAGAKPRETFYYYFQGSALEAVRRDHWKLVLPHEHRTYQGVLPGSGGIDGDTRQVKTELALYDLRRDPGERYDVQAGYPEVVQMLQALAAEAREDLGDDRRGITGKNVREAGRINK